MLNPDWYLLDVVDGVDLNRPGIYQWEIAGSGRYIGKYTRSSRPLKEYERNVRRLLAGEAYRPAKPDGFRYIHRALAEAVGEGRSITLSILENVDPALLGARERSLVRERQCNLNGSGPLQRVAAEPVAVSLDEIGPLIEAAKQTAKRYYALTGKPLGITGEVGEYEAARLLGLTLLDARSPGYDAIDAQGRRIQIKTRMYDPGKALGGQRMGAIKAASIFDEVMLVMLDMDYSPWIIWRAGRGQVLDALAAPGSKSRNERGALSVSKFRSFAEPVWVRE